VTSNYFGTATSSNAIIPSTAIPVSRADRFSLFKNRLTILSGTIGPHEVSGYLEGYLKVPYSHGIYHVKFFSNNLIVSEALRQFFEAGNHFDLDKIVVSHFSWTYNETAKWLEQLEYAIKKP
jgi:hypothetical protein